MRSGVIAQKVGMTRVFTDAGEHVPVTVLKLDGCQVVAHRTMEKNGYTACSSASAAPRSRTSRRPSAAASPSRKVEPKLKLAEFRVGEDDLLPVGAEITADHFVVGQFVDVTGTTLGKGFAGPMKRWNFGGLARHPRRVRVASFAWFDRRPSGSGQDLQEQEDGRPHGHGPRDDAEPARRADRRRARPDPGRGFGSRPRRRLDLRPRRGEEGAADRGSEARQVPHVRKPAANAAAAPAETTLRRAEP